MPDVKLTPRVRAFRQHVSALCKLHNIKTIRCRRNNKAGSWRPYRKVRLALVKSAATYAVALHEIGHVIGPQYGPEINREAQAWVWARKHALEWGNPMKKTAAHYMRSYLDWARKNYPRRVPPFDHPARKIEGFRGEHRLRLAA
jgi:hypothetical protein